MLTQELFFGRDDAVAVDLTKELQDAVVQLFTNRIRLLNEIRCFMTQNSSAMANPRNLHEDSNAVDETLEALLRAAHLAGLVEIPNAIRLILQNSRIAQGNHSTSWQDSLQFLHMQSCAGQVL